MNIEAEKKRLCKMNWLLEAIEAETQFIRTAENTMRELKEAGFPYSRCIHNIDIYKRAKGRLEMAYFKLNGTLNAEIECLDCDGQGGSIGSQDPTDSNKHVCKSCSGYGTKLVEITEESFLELYYSKND